MKTLTEAIAACPTSRDAFADALGDGGKTLEARDDARESLAQDGAGGWDAFFGILAVGGGAVGALVTCLAPEPALSKVACGGSLTVMGAGIGVLAADEVGDADSARQALRLADLLYDEALEDLEASFETFVTCVKTQLASD